MSEFKIKDCFICNFCREVCKGGCNEIKELILSGKIKKDDQLYKENIDLASDRKQIIDCLGKYCDKPCKYQNMEANPPIEILIKTIKYLGSKCNKLIEEKNKKIDAI